MLSALLLFSDRLKLQQCCESDLRLVLIFMTLIESYSHMIVNWVLGNLFTFMMVIVSWGYMIVVCHPPRQLLASKTNREGIREGQKLWSCDVSFNDCTT